MSDPKTAREQTARNIAAEQERSRRPPIGYHSPAREVEHRRRLAKIRRIAEARAAAVTDKNEGQLDPRGDHRE